MFGLCAFRNLASVLLFVLTLSPSVLWAQKAQKKVTPAATAPAKKSAAKGVTAMVIGESPYVFSDANFDSAVIGEFRLGQRVVISKAKKGPFHRVRLPNKKLGWIADSEIKIMSAKAIETAQKQQQRIEEEVGDIFSDSSGDLSELEDNPNRRRQFMQWSRHMGIALDNVQYSEKTQGEDRVEAINFIGFRATGADTLFSGLVSADTHILFSTKAPGYYKKITGYEASGLIALAHFQFLTQTPLSKNTVYHYGFGPMVKYSQLNIKTSTNNYVAQDLNIGAVFGVGLGFKVGSFALRPDFKYYWEKSKYWSLGLGILYQY